jgi:exosome complex exonuclease DIS3/RRP44
VRSCRQPEPDRPYLDAWRATPLLTRAACLADDLPVLDPATASRPPSGQWLVLDTNVVLHQMDVLEHSAISHCIILQTGSTPPPQQPAAVRCAQRADSLCVPPASVLDETRHRNVGLYNRLRKCTGDSSKQFTVFSNEHHRQTYVERRPGESANDRNDRAIRQATGWYSKHLASTGVKVAMVTNDAANKQLALSSGVSSISLHKVVEGYSDHPELQDLLAHPDEDTSETDASSGRRGPPANIFDEHIPLSEVLAGIRSGELQQGVFHSNVYNMNEAHVAVQSKGTPAPKTEEDVGDVDEEVQNEDESNLLFYDSNSVLVSGLVAQNRATDGDVVAIKMLPESEWAAPSDSIIEGDGGGDDGPAGSSERSRPCAKVVGVIRRAWRPYCGTLDVKNHKGSLKDGASTNLLFVPVEKTIPRIRIRTRQAATLANKRIVVAIDTWERTSRCPQGHYVRVVGDVGDKATETELLLLENQIPTRPFSKAAMDELPSEGAAWRPSPEEIARRVDYRTKCPRICSIDPPGCTDIDDALHCRTLPNGNIEIGVHIADVTYFLKSGSVLDGEALERGTTVYLVDRRIEMLPALLTSDLCSLRSDVDRLAFTTVWELDKDTLEVVSTDFHRSVIKSCRSFTYGEAQMRMDDASLDDPLTLELRLMNRIAKKLRKDRFDRGALALSSPEVKFKLDSETQNPNDVAMYELKEANAMVEEYMLLANCSVGTKILQNFPSFALLRRHPSPPAQNFDWLIESAANVGVELDVSSSKRLAETLDAASMPDHPYFQTLLRIMATRCMTRALYFCTGYVEQADYLHYGLAAPIYTHFTSPIRRYADVVVHRLLAAALRYTTVPTLLEDKASVREICEIINRRNHASQLASRGSTALHTLLYFKNNPVFEEAMVMKVKSNGFISLIPRFGIEGIVYVSEKDDENSGWAMAEDEQSLSGPGGVVIKVFDAVPVRISVEDGAEKISIDLVLEKLGGGVGSAESAPTPAPNPKPTSAGGKGTKRERDAPQEQAPSPGSGKKKKKKKKKNQQD